MRSLFFLLLLTTTGCHLLNNTRFTPEYIAANDRTVRVEIREVHELANIMVALSRIGQLDSNMIDMTTPYYQRVRQHFDPHREHPAIGLMNEQLTEVFGDATYDFYYNLKMNANGYVFDDERIVSDGIIRRMGWLGQPDPWTKHADLFADFARVSDFRSFYQRESEHYAELIRTYHELCPLEQMNDWLEGWFGRSYGSYLVLFSPLVGGAHSANRYRGNGFTISAMFMGPAMRYERYSDTLNELINSRLVFTEIDHNFVNPVSDRFRRPIRDLFGDRDRWVRVANGNNTYASPLSVFNEYMTWAVYLVYCDQYYSPETVASYVPLIERTMHRRGFYRFPAFAARLRQIVAEAPDISVEETYRTLLNNETLLLEAETD